MTTLAAVVNLSSLESILPPQAPLQSVMSIMG
jgi:hypothetical protein